MVIVSYIAFQLSLTFSQNNKALVGMMMVLGLAAVGIPVYALVRAIINKDIGTLVTIAVATVVNVLLSPLIVILIIYIHVYNPRLLSSVFETY